MAHDLLPRVQTKSDFRAFIATEPEGRFEFDGEQIVAMTGGTNRHNILTKRSAASLDGQLDPTLWLVLQHNGGVETEQTIRYPDVLVTPLPADLEARIVSSPTIVIEVTSPSTATTDLTDKPIEYGSVDTIEAVLVFRHDARSCAVWQRRTDGTFDPTPQLITAGRVSLASQSLELQLAMIYDGLVD